MDRTTAVKLAIYETVARTARVPLINELAEQLGEGVVDVRQAIAELASQRLLVLEVESGEIRMAPPFSAVPTAHRVTVGDQTYVANCIWDAFGIAAALQDDAEVRTSCGDCDEPMAFMVQAGRPLAVPCAIHYAVPAAHWWDDIVHS
jgi:hypothetical protein